MLAMLRRVSRGGNMTYLDWVHVGHVEESEQGR